MKILKSLLLMMLVAFTVSLQSCGGEDDEPKPVTEKTDLELVKEGILGKWTFVSSVVTKDGVSFTYNGDCNFTGKPSWYQANSGDVDYTFTKTDVSKTRNCNNESFGGMGYTISEVNGKFLLNLTDGAKYELITTPDKVSGNIIKVKDLSLQQDADEAILTYQK